MSDITKKSKDILDDLKYRSLASKVSNLKSKLINFNKNKNLVLLCDVSGSMRTIIDYETSARAIDVLNHVLENFPGAQLWAFSNNTFKVHKLPEPLNSTNMGRAFTRMKNEGFKEIILLSDGAPDSPDDALNNAIGLKINIIYIGPKPIPNFLIELANLTGGSFDDIELMKLGSAQGEKELENKIKGFLT